MVHPAVTFAPRSGPGAHLRSTSGHWWYKNPPNKKRSFMIWRKCHVFASLYRKFPNKRTGRTEVGASSKSSKHFANQPQNSMFLLDQFGSVGLFLWSSNVEKIDQTPHKAAILSAFLAIYTKLNKHRPCMHDITL